MSQLALQMDAAADPLAWWGDLRHGGMLLSTAKVTDLTKRPPPTLTPRQVEQLRAGLTPILAGTAPGPDAIGRLLDVVLEDALGYGSGWLKAKDVPPSWGRKAMTGETVKPRRLWAGEDDAVLPVFVVDSDVRLGVGRGRRDVARVVEWLRKATRPLALVTNGRQWRVVHAGADYDAFAEWDAEGWFEQGRPSAQLEGFRQLLRDVAVLNSAIMASRKGQAELSQVLGERVRLAVELLIRAQSGSLDAIRAEVETREIYVAACRIVMRLVVLLFAEARDLLPRDNANYHRSYGLEGLRDALDRAGDPARRRHMHGAWPRLLALFQLVHGGSAHPDLLVPAYGGDLFAPGDARAADGIARALATLETAEDVDDQVVLEMLELLTRTRVRIPQGRQAKWVTAPVDFSDLSSEYIGILYEGLLDYELHRVADEPVLFLNLGTQPALPLARLEALDDKALKALMDVVKKSAKKPAPGEADGEPDEAEEPNESLEDAAEELEDELDADAEAADAAEAIDERRLTIDRARAWAERAVRVGKLLGARDLKDSAKMAAKARALVSRTVLPGEWYLVRWGGTRKGAGTFYTRPQLAVPTVMRTLRPLAYVEPGEAGGEWTPRPPEEILALKVCDPAMGSGSFLVAALRYLTTALHASLHAHGRIRAHGRKAVITLAAGTKSSGRLAEETLPVPPDDPTFDDRLHAVLKRHVVENCLYGVDLDALAVELGRMALWVETLNRELPFGFLDHKLKVGNSLVGAWFDTFQQYPLGAWEREGGDKGHKGVHFTGDAWTKAIKAGRQTVKAEAKTLARRQLDMFKTQGGGDAAGVHDTALEVLERLHSVPVHQAEKRARIYREEIRDSQAITTLRQAMDLWCALWFWPATELDKAPTPATLRSPCLEALGIVAQLATSYRFFHWELEFPDVFAGVGGGFSGVVGNPPWEIQKPNSKEYFSNVDALYRAYGKQEALQYQQQYFEADQRIEAGWLAYTAKLKAMGNWVKHVGAAEARGLSYSDPAHPFRHQGSADLNTYKMFLELAHALLRQDGGLGFVVPSGLYSDKGTRMLRKLFLEDCRWEWLFGFENRERIFNIHRSYKFCPLVVRKGGRTERVMAAFMRHDVQDWVDAERYVVPYFAEQVRRYSPRSHVLLEIRTTRDLSVLSSIYAGGVLLGQEGPGGWCIGYSCEYHMTNDSKHFKPRSTWEDQGFKPDLYGRWVGPEGKRALPLYEGRMIGQFDFSEKGWVSGKGRSAVWRDIPFDAKVIESQYLMAEAIAVGTDGEAERPEDDEGSYTPSVRLSFMDVTASTNRRTMIASLVPGFPCGNSAPVLTSIDDACLSVVLNSFVYDFAVRLRCGGLHLNYFVIEESPLIRPELVTVPFVGIAALALNCPNIAFASCWLKLAQQNPDLRQRAWRMHWAVTASERARLRAALDAWVAHCFGLTEEEFSYVLDPDPGNPKGFWRVDDDLPVEIRLTTLALAAFRDLQRLGIDGFFAQNDGEGWLLPEYLEINGQKRQVREALGPRYHAWQLEQAAGDSWLECEQHARAILGEKRFEEFTDGAARVATAQPKVVQAAAPQQLPLFEGM